MDTTESDIGDSCVYCGSIEDLTVDHVPPGAIFPPPRPSSLVTVRACGRCNKGASKDDEHFRMMLCLREDVGESSEARKNWQPILRSLRRPQAAGMKASLLRGLRPVHVTTPGGLYLGRRLGFDVDLRRIHRVVERTVRGLHYRELGRRVPEGHQALVCSDDSLAGTPPEMIEELRRTILLPLAATPEKVIAPGVFSYRFQAGDDPTFSAWALTFYGRVSFLVLTSQPEVTSCGR